jgi:hypothetical protein
MSIVRKVGHFVRWKLVATRYATRAAGLKWSKVGRPAPPRMATTAEVERIGSAPGPAIPPDMLQRMKAIYQPRGASVQPKATGHPFVNLFQADDITPDNPVMQFAFSPAVLDVAADYFGGKLILDSLQVLYSYPTEGSLRESQHWHLDYGDTRSFHCVAYLNDVLTIEAGPFVHVDKIATRKVGRSSVVRRIDDTRFAQESGHAEPHIFYGPAGSSVLVDPSACYHYGSRCKTPRLALFVTFSSWFPFAQPVPEITRHKAQLAAVAKSIRPDLSDEFIATLLQIG